MIKCTHLPMYDVPDEDGLFKYQYQCTMFRITITHKPSGFTDEDGLSFADEDGHFGLAYHNRLIQRVFHLIWRLLSTAAISGCLGNRACKQGVRTSQLLRGAHALVRGPSRAFGRAFVNPGTSYYIFHLVRVRTRLVQANDADTEELARQV